MQGSVIHMNMQECKLWAVLERTVWWNWDLHKSLAFCALEHVRGSPISPSAISRYYQYRIVLPVTMQWWSGQYLLPHRDHISPSTWCTWTRAPMWQRTVGHIAGTSSADLPAPHHAEGRVLWLGLWMCAGKGVAGHHGTCQDHIHCQIFTRADHQTVDWHGDHPWPCDNECSHPDQLIQLTMISFKMDDRVTKFKMQWSNYTSHWVMGRKRRRVVLS